MFEYFDIMYGNDLSHSIRGGNNAGTGKERAGHKYQSRYWKNGRWNYVYKDSNGNLKSGNKSGKLSDTILEKRRANVHNSQGGRMAQYAYEIHNANQEYLKNHPMYDTATTTLDQDKLIDIDNYARKNNGYGMTRNDYENAASSTRKDTYADTVRKLSAASGYHDATSGNIVRNAKAGVMNNSETKQAASKQRVGQQAAKQRNSVNDNKIKYQAASQRASVANNRTISPEYYEERNYNSKKNKWN